MTEASVADAPPRPRRKRWFLVILVTAMLVLSTAAWWNWPRGDARFLGRWRLSDDADGMWHLKANGVAAYEDPLSGTTMRTSWHVEGDRFQLGRSMLIPQSPFRQWFVEFWNTHTPWFWAEYGAVYKILKLEGDDLHCEDGTYEGGEQFADRIAAGPLYIFKRQRE